LRTAIVTLANLAEPVVRQIKALLPEARVYGRAGRVDWCDEHFDLASVLLPALYREGVAIVAVCSSGIVVRCLGPVLADKHLEPPVVAVSSDGASVVPLIGGHRGANRLAREIGAHLGAHAAITTAADVTLGVALDEPLPGYRLATPEHYPNAVSRLLAGEALRDGSDAPPVVGVGVDALPTGGNDLSIAVSDRALPSRRGTLHYAPKNHVVGVGCERGCGASELLALVTESLEAANISPASVAAVVSLDLKADEPAVLALADSLAVPARFFDRDALAAEADRLANPDVGRARGTLHLIGTGPGQADWRLPAVDRVLADCTDLVAYGYYVDLLGAAAGDKTVHSFALGEEELRSRRALELAAEGKTVGLVCSGDPGVYAMGALVFELVERGGVDAWRRVEIVTTPGITALQVGSRGRVDYRDDARCTRCS